MKIIELVEARKNPQDNPKLPINQHVIKAVDQVNDYIGDVKNVFVSFTSIDKLGINPKSKYDTPIGIYAYPGSYVKQEIGYKQSMTDLPFAGGSPFVNIFTTRGNIIVVSNMSSDEVAGYYKKIANVWSKESGEDWKTSVDQVEELINKSDDYAKFSSYPGGRFWYVTMKVAELMSRRSGSKRSNAWNKLFRLIGIDGAVDMGSGIIHTSEPSQAVFFNPTVITDNKRYYNKYSPADRSDAWEVGDERKADAERYGPRINAMKDPSEVADFIQDRGMHLVRLIRNPALRTAVLRELPDAALYVTRPTAADIVAMIQERIGEAYVESMLNNTSEKEVIKTIHTVSDNDLLFLYHAMSPIMDKFSTNIKLAMVKKFPPSAAAIDNIKPGLAQYAIKLWKTEHGPVPFKLKKLAGLPTDPTSSPE